MPVIISRMTHAERRERCNRIRARVADGEQVADVAASEGVQPGTIYAMCDGMQLPPRPPRPPRPPKERVPAKAVPGTYAIIGMLINEDMTFADIGRAHELSRERIRQIYINCLAHGIPVRKR